MAVTRLASSITFVSRYIARKASDAKGMARISKRPPDTWMSSDVMSPCPMAISCRVSADPGWRTAT